MHNKLPGGVGEALGLLLAIKGLHLIQLPSGRWGFTGRVPVELGYRYKDGSGPPSAEDARGIAQHGAGLFKKRIESCAWNSVSEALAAARALGFEPENVASFA